MQTALLISQAMPTDAALMASLHASAFDRGWDEQAMATFLAGPGTLCLIGFAGDQPIPAGLLIARRASYEAEILTFCVTPSCRRVGLGRALLRRAVDELRESGATRLFLEVDEGNAAALALYRSLGAETVGRRPGYYEGGANATILSLALSDSRSDDGPSPEESRGER